MRFKKLRKVYRVYFPIKFTAKEIFENCLKNNKEIDFFEKEKESYNVFLVIIWYLNKFLILKNMRLL
jgi:hypothetical protein